MPENLFQSVWLTTLLIILASTIVVLNMIRKTIKLKRGYLTGDWVQKIYDPDTLRLVKLDQIKCKHLGERVDANIVRIFPVEQRGRSWTFSGGFRELELFGSFKSKDIKDPSFGTIFMRQVAIGHFKGSYTKSSNSYGENQEWPEFSLSMRQIPLEWEFGAVSQKEQQAAIVSE